MVFCGIVYKTHADRLYNDNWTMRNSLVWYIWNIIYGIVYRTHADRLYDNDDDNGPMRNSSLFSVSPGAHLGLGCARQIERRVVEWNGKHGCCMVLCGIAWYCVVLCGIVWYCVEGGG